jgi:hypothetical protein
VPVFGVYEPSGCSHSGLVSTAWDEHTSFSLSKVNLSSLVQYGKHCAFGLTASPAGDWKSVTGLPPYRTNCNLSSAPSRSLPDNSIFLYCSRCTVEIHSSPNMFVIFALYYITSLCYLLLEALCRYRVSISEKYHCVHVQLHFIHFSVYREWTNEWPIYHVCSIGAYSAVISLLGYFSWLSLLSSMKARILLNTSVFS